MRTVLMIAAAFLVVLSPLLVAAVVVRIGRWVGTRPGRHRRRRVRPGRARDLGSQDVITDSGALAEGVPPTGTDRGR